MLQVCCAAMLCFCNRYVRRRGSHPLSTHYMQAIDGVAPPSKDYNPATWMLEVSGGGAKMHTEAADADFAQLYLESALCRETDTRAAEIAAESAKQSQPIALSSRYAASLRRQIEQLLYKLFIVYW